jgi:hypothetical protein
MRCRLDGLNIRWSRWRFTAGATCNEKQQGGDRVKSLHLHSPSPAVENALILEGEDVDFLSHIVIIRAP